MGANTKISWADDTFNPWIGCTKVSPGCDHCYAEAQDKHRKWTSDGWGPGKPRHRTSKTTWNNPVKWNREAEAAGSRRRVFCASLADVFDNEIPQEWRADLWALVRATPYLDWLILTKRIGNAKKMLPDDLLKNVWLGVSIVNQAEANRDILKLLETPAMVRFVSYEPALEAVDFDQWDHVGGLNRGEEIQWFNLLDWVIVGGESGPKARPFHLAWARNALKQCRAGGAACFVKQMGSNPVDGFAGFESMPMGLNHPKGEDPQEWPEDLRVQEMPEAAQ